MLGWVVSVCLSCLYTAIPTPSFCGGLALYTITTFVCLLAMLELCPNTLQCNHWRCWNPVLMQGCDTSTGTVETL